MIILNIKKIFLLLMTKESLENERDGTGENGIYINVTLGVWLVQTLVSARGIFVKASQVSAPPPGKENGRKSRST